MLSRMAQLGRHRGPRGAPQPELGRAGHGMQPGHQKQGGGGGASVAPSSSSDSSGDSDSGGSSSGGAIGAVNSAVFRESDSSTAALPHERNARLALDDRGSSQSTEAGRRLAVAMATASGVAVGATLLVI
jgi:hypothetical protein